MFRNPRYVIAVHDLVGTARFYRDVLGFAVHEIGDPGWVFLVRDACFIMAGRCPESLPPRELGDHSYFAYVEVDAVAELYESVRDHGVEIVKPLTPEPWGMIEFGLRTPEGHRMMFASQIAAG
ncbi:MAG: VOC family protein [Thermoanaerobaculia bacterium]